MINIRTDSRKVKPGDIFVAMPGYNSDGHSYIPKAIENGAGKLIVEKGTYDVPFEIVENSREYLNNYLVNNYRKYLDEMTITGITGTNGKTTTAYLIYDALNKLGIKCAYIGTIGFYMNGKVRDLPNTSPDVCDMYELIIEAYDSGYKHVVIETSSQGLDGGRLDGILFDYAVFTNLTQDHLDYHKTMENYATAKQLLFKKLKENGKAIINADDPYSKYFYAENGNNIYYGFNSGDYLITDYKLTNQETVFDYKKGQDIFKINSPLIGDYNISNLLVAIIILEQIGISYEDISRVCPLLENPSGRMDTVKYNTNSIIVDYAHTPDALSKIIDTTLLLTMNNVYVVFGCTGDRDRTKRPIMTKIVTDKCKHAIITIDDPHNEDIHQIFDDMTSGIVNTNYEICEDRGLAISRGINLLKENDTLLILGKGHEKFIIYKDEHIPFNDKETVINYLKEKND